MSEVKPIENISNSLQSFLKISLIQSLSCRELSDSKLTSLCTFDKMVMSSLSVEFFLFLIGIHSMQD